MPEEVLKEAAAEMLDYKGSGMSVMEMSHRSKVYETIIQEAEADRVPVKARHRLQKAKPLRLAELLIK